MNVMLQLKSPCPSDLAQMLGKDGAEGLVVHHGGESNAVQASANSPDSQRPATGESQGNAGAATKPASAQSTINPLARPFTSKLNPNTTAFMPSTSRPPASSPSPGPLTTSAPRERVVSVGPPSVASLRHSLTSSDAAWPAEPLLWRRRCQAWPSRHACQGGLLALPSSWWRQLADPSQLECVSPPARTP